MTGCRFSTMTTRCSAVFTSIITLMSAGEAMPISMFSWMTVSRPGDVAVNVYLPGVSPPM